MVQKFQLPVDEKRETIAYSELMLTRVANQSSYRIEAAGTRNENEPSDMKLFDRISAEIGDEVLGAPGDLPSAFLVLFNAS